MVIPEKLGIAFRYFSLDPARDATNDHFIKTIGAVSYFFNKHNLELQTDV
jgi:phosphate-selective porin OprO/OprP